jgi:ureidoglycolate hydrolase
MELKVQELTKEAFEPFGDVIQKPERAQDAGGPGWKWWGDNAFLESEDRPYQVGYLDLVPGELKVDWAERHMRTAELIVPTGGDCLVYVGPPDHSEEPGRMPAPDRFQVFRVPQNQAVLLKKGTWHCVPLAIDRPLNVVILLRKGSGDDDLFIQRFPEAPVSITP